MSNGLFTLRGMRMDIVRTSTVRPLSAASMINVPCVAENMPANQAVGYDVMGSEFFMSDRLKKLSSVSITDLISSAMSIFFMDAIPNCKPGIKRCPAF
jgi:hypothetical protein